MKTPLHIVCQGGNTRATSALARPIPISTDTRPHRLHHCKSWDEGVVELESAQRCPNRLARCIAKACATVRAKPCREQVGIDLRARHDESNASHQ